MIIYPYPVEKKEDLLSALHSLGADLRSMAFFCPKRDVWSLLVPDADFRAAAFLKQELLARGGDAVVNRGVIACTAERSGVLLLGTPGQLSSLKDKLGSMSCWGLDAIRDALGRALDGLAKNSWTMPLRSGRSLHLGCTTRMMAILNLTSDSFFSESRIDPASEESLLKRASEMIGAGAAILDVGAESTRPGSLPVSAQEETARLIPALKTLRKAFPEAILSADTWKGEVALEALRAGADIINDISGLAFDPLLPSVAADEGAVLVLSHIRGTPRDMQVAPRYGDTVREILSYFEERLVAAEKAGIRLDRIILDPGMGFGKRYEDNLRILNNLEAFRTFGLPLLVGHSRKTFIGQALGGADPQERLEGTLAVTALCSLKDVPLVRIHDARENGRVLAVLEAIKGAGR